MGDKKSISALVSGGEANAGPPLGPALGPIGVNVLQVVNAINEKTKDFPGMKVPVKVEVDSETKKFTVEVGLPPTAALVAKEANITKGSAGAGVNYAGNISMDSAVKIAKMKLESSYAKDIKGIVKEIIGSCLSSGIKVEDKPAKEVYIDISAGKYDELFSIHNIDYGMATSDNKQKLEKKIGEVVGLEMAAQKAVDELGSRGLLDVADMKSKLERMRKEANNHQMQLEQLAQKLSESEGLDTSNIQNTARETEEKASEIMKTYLGENPDSAEAIEFLCLAEGGEVVHYEVLSAMAKNIKNRQFSAKVKSILEEEQKHLKLCTRLAKQTATSK